MLLRYCDLLLFLGYSLHSSISIIVEAKRNILYYIFTLSNSNKDFVNKCIRTVPSSDQVLIASALNNVGQGFESPEALDIKRIALRLVGAVSEC